MYKSTPHRKAHPMCGRFALAMPAKSIAEHFGLESTEGLSMRYNIAPTQEVATVSGASEGQGRALAIRRWGMIPHWAKDAKIGARMINARAETIDSKPSFREPFRRRRCLIPASGFYEWRREVKTRLPYYIRLRDRSPMAFAGLWDRWQPGDGEPVESCTIITTGANEIVGELHDRMPVILDPGDYNRWLDTRAANTGGLLELLAPYPSNAMDMIPVGDIVNNARNEDPRCIEPAGQV